eukprot:scaffold84740_cov75-Phaeocystis_antarctica.AAC.6
MLGAARTPAIAAATGRKALSCRESDAPRRLASAYTALALRSNGLKKASRARGGPKKQLSLPVDPTERRATGAHPTISRCSGGGPDADAAPS